MTDDLRFRCFRLPPAVSFAIELLGEGGGLLLVAINMHSRACRIPIPPTKTTSFPTNTTTHAQNLWVGLAFLEELAKLCNHVTLTINKLIEAGVGRTNYVIISIKTQRGVLVMIFISLGEGQKASLGIEVGGRDRIQVDGEGNIEVEGEPVQTELDPVPVCVCVREREREHRKHLIILF